MRTISTKLDDILSLVNAAEDYGFNRDILMMALGDITGLVSDEEISEYAAWFISEQGIFEGYGEEDMENAEKRVTEWRDKYCK